MLVVGLGAGLSIALGAARSVASLLYKVEPLDPGVLMTALVVMAVVALTAVLIPGLRATRVDPAETLRRG